MNCYKAIQLTNTNIGAVAVDTLMPYGNITRRINTKNCTSFPFATTTSNIDTIVINEDGYYKITYNASVVAGAAGVVTFNILLNNAVVYTISQTAAAEGDTVNMTGVYEIRVCPNNCCNPYNLPVNIQTQLTTTALTGGISNILVEKVNKD